MEDTNKLTKKPISNFSLMGVFLSAFIWVVLLWRFFDHGVYVLGFNVLIFGGLLFYLFILKLKLAGHFSRQDLYWIIPVIILILSYGIYENPFLKITSLLVLPLIFAIFYNQAFLTDKKNQHWEGRFIRAMINRIFSFPAFLYQAVLAYGQLIVPAGKGRKSLLLRIIGGLLLFILIAFLVFIPLLSAADPVFVGTMNIIYQWFLGIFSQVISYKILLIITLSIFFSALLIAWTRPFIYQLDKRPTIKLDSVVSGIVLSGILGLYLLFLGLQINYLWIGSLPVDFKATESLVKSGFWQLIILSLINILIYFFTYKKTGSVGQKILILFSSASLLLLFSAAYRMSLYVWYYGFSYEKFFASYAVLYCVTLFTYLIIKLFSRVRANILKFAILLFVWMYSLVSLLPVEQIIMRSNVALANSAETRIRLPELTMLSADVLYLVERYEKQGILLAREGSYGQAEPFNWQPWIEKQRKVVFNKAWYEKNLVNFLYLMKN